MTRTVRYCFALPFALGAALFFAPVLHAQRPAQPAQPEKGQAVTRAQGRELEPSDSGDTRRAFEELARTLPPDLIRVLKLDPSLLDSQDYLAPYPGLWEFAQQHPEIRRNPRYFFENLGSGSGSGPASPEQALAEARLRMWDGLIGGFAAFCVFLVVTAAILWLTKLIVEQRRWNRISKIQADAHNKLLDKFASNEELVAYIQTPAGRRFLESAPIPLRESPAAIGAPYSRILWSLQAGVVLIIAGLGLLIASGRLPEEPRQFFGIISVLAMSLGAGFAVSSGAAYMLSRRLGLFDKPSADHA